MRSIEKSFKHTQVKNPYWSTFTCYANAVKGRSFSKDSIQRNFNKLVDKNDYAKDERVQILTYLYDITKNEL
ncbi:MAG: hypothetical protein NTW98_00490 [Candidatus Nomurabacteria bacterium]|nr:hypothetical protein [Candidatus Nomurabacteria bacterium]